MELQYVDVSSIVFFLFVFLLSYTFLRLTRRPKKQLPGPKGLPFIGRPLFLHSSRKRRNEVALEAAKVYGNIFSFKQGPYNLVMINGFDNIHEIFVRRSDEFSDRPSWLLPLKKALAEGKGLVWQSGHPWKVMRKFTIQTLRDFGVGKTSIEEKILQEIDATSQEFYEMNGRPTDVRILTSMMISNVIYGIVFGRRFTYSDTFFHELLHNMDTVFSGGGIVTMAAYLPEFLVRIIKSSELDLQKKISAAMDFLRTHIYNEIKRHEESFDRESIRDFVDLYIETARSEKESSPDEFNHGNIFLTILDIFVAGSETTSNTINWCILYLMERLDIQQKCYEEIQQNCGERRIRWEDKGKCPYVEATLLEIQRVANIAPFSLPHTNPAEATVQGYTISKNSLIFANIYSSHMDPKYWDEPEVFRPERFLEAGNKLKKNPAFIPFSTGPRMCLGDTLAKMEMFLIFTNLIQSFEFRRENEDLPHDLQPRLDQATNAPKPYKVCAVKRN